MEKKKKGKVKKNIPKDSTQELLKSRDGGRIALSGFTYQFLYSCYIILSEKSNDILFRLEGIEDIDKINYMISDDATLHIQLKYSKNKQDASFLKDVLKNYLEVYLIDRNTKFKLVYDFEIAKGNLSKLIENNLDVSSNNYWIGIIDKIKEETPLWNWSDFSYSNFKSTISFEKKRKKDLSKEIEMLLLSSYDITTGNIKLYANGIKIYCLEKMEQMCSIDKSGLENLILSIKDDISRGAHNPAHGWIKSVSFEPKSNINKDSSYFEGKKPTYQDIAQQLPVRRILLEEEVTTSIEKNSVTVIKASSGQGKTTLALQVAYNLKSEYKIYQLLWCNDPKELIHIVSYFSTRVKMGEKPLIIIDNLDSQLSEWNKLAQLLQDEIRNHYKIVITTREDDWYNYSGDVSCVKSLQVIKLFLREEEAKRIFDILNQAGKIHSSIVNWKKSFEIVKEKSLLIEYIYILTHGEMLSERIENQIKKISASNSGNIKCEILRKICFADICGIKLSVNKLISSLTETSSYDYGELLKSVENEFLIKINSSEKYIEGLHPVRSQHIVDKLHEFIELETTALQVIKIVDNIYYSKLFSYFPKTVNNKEQFYVKLVETLWDKNNLSPYVDALRGIFSGSVQQYYYVNQNIYDNSNEHGGLILFDAALNPFTKFEEIDESIHSLDELRTLLPENKNIEYLCKLRDATPKMELSKTDIYLFCKALYNYIKRINIFDVSADINSFSIIMYWLINIEKSFDLSSNISLKLIWENCTSYSVDTIASIMYTYFCGNKEKYIEFVNENLDDILTYLRNETKSLQVYVSEGKDKNLCRVYTFYNRNKKRN
ncbi:MAG: ABC transporter ATP-binding protein [Culicoidibacterales bacterium]